MILEHHKDPGRAVEVTPVPRALRARTDNETGAIRPIPVEPITAEAQFEVDELRKPAFFTDPVVRAAMDVMEANHQAFICDGVEAVELRRLARSRVPALGLGQVELVGTGPVHAFGPVRTLEKVIAFKVVAAAAAGGAPLDALHPLVAEGIEEKGAVVVGGDGCGDRVRPGLAVGDVE